MKIVTGGVGGDYIKPKPEYADKLVVAAIVEDLANAWAQIHRLTDRVERLEGPRAAPKPTE